MARPKIRIGITMRTIMAEGYHERRDALAQDWPPFLSAALPDASWIYLPSLGAERITAYCQDWGVNGIILSGGEDIGTAPLRDETELALLKWAEVRAFPVLGICRGMQLMTKAAGGELIDLADHVATRHRFVETGREVNSYHTKGIGKCPPGYRVLATAGDGTIEAIRHSYLPWHGWMWHPERETPGDADDFAAVKEIFS